MDSIHAVCPKCGHQFQQTLAALKSSAAIACPVCGEIIENNPDAIAAAEKQIDKILGETTKDLTRNIKGFKAK